MKKITFIDMLASKSVPFLFMMIVVLYCRVFGKFLSTHYSDYSTNNAFKLLIWAFTPMVNINPLWAIAMLTAGYVMLVYVEYYFNKIS